MVAPVLGNPNKVASFKKIYSDPLIIVSIIMKLILLAYFSIYLGHWYSSDTNHYLMAAEQVCKGEWGGDSFRGSTYLWFLCATSLGKVFKGNELLSGGGVNLSIIVQSVIVFLCGIFLYRKFGRKISLLWLFDPVINLYAVFVMSDVLFSVIALFYAFYFYKLLKIKKSIRYPIFFGILWGILILTRPIAIPYSYFQIIFIIILLLRKNIKIKPAILIAVSTFLILTPKLFWNYQKTGTIYISEQSSGWLQSIAGIVENDEKGISFHEASMIYYKDHPNAQLADVLKSLSNHFPRTIFLMSKSMMRVLFGHVNVEANYLVSGRAIEGPGWFKKPEKALGPPLEDKTGILFWTFGLVYCFVWCAWVYGGLITTVMKVRHFDFISSLKELRIENKIWLWSLISIFILTFLPLFVGDARFRLPVWSFVLISYGIALNIKRMHSEHSIG